MNNVFVVAHRGFSVEYPENTLLAFREAIELGVDFIEIDVHETKDGTLVVIHDHTLERTTDGRGAVKEKTFEEIQTLDAGKWKGKFEGVKIPSLDEVLGFVAGKTRLLIEIKDANPEKICKLLLKHRMENYVVIASFDMEKVIRTRQMAPSVSTALISTAFPENPDILVKNGIPIVEIEYHSVSEAEMKEFVLRGISVGVWTVDDENDMKRLLNTGIPFITTNRPDLLKKCLVNAATRP